AAAGRSTATGGTGRDAVGVGRGNHAPRPAAGTVVAYRDAAHYGGDSLTGPQSPGAAKSTSSAQRVLGCARCKNRDLPRFTIIETPAQLDRGLRGGCNLAVMGP